RAAADLVQRRVPIGRAVRNLELYVVDPRLRLAPARVPGELCVGGIAVGRGYLNDPALTAEVFVPDPWSGRPGARLYKSGDLVRLHEDGVLELRWRIDQQIKIRGFRVELEEIEAVLRQHPEVVDAAVVAKGEGADRRLLAFLVPASAAGAGEELDAGLAERLAPGVRAFVAERLPDYMVPAGFALLPTLPLTQHGKLNRIRLERAEWELSATGYEAPATPLQDILATIWGEVLSLPRVGLNDNFFISGGNSLSAIQVVSRIRRTLKVEVALRSLFDAPTLGALSLVVEQAMQSGRGAELPPIRPVARNQDLPLSFAQERLWFVHQMAPESPVYNIPVALRIERPVDAAALRRAVEGVVERHEVLRTAFEAIDGEPFQRIAPAAALPLPVIDLAALAPAVREAAAGAVVQQLARVPFDVRRAPLLRLALLKLAAADHVVSITAHHLVTDAWSTRILIHEMATLYGQVSRSLPDLPIQYADFASWQRQWLQGETLQAELAWWRERLGGSPPLLELPADRPRPAVQSYRGQRQPAALPLAASEALRAASRREGATLFMLLLAGYQALLFRYTGQSDICVGTPVAGRFQQETENLIGVFINTLVLRGRPAAEVKFRQLVAQTRDTVLEVFAHPHMPFEKLVEELHPERSLQHNPLFQTMLILQNLARVQVEGMTTEAADEAPGMSYLPVDNSSSRFDLLLQLYDGGEGELFGILEFSADLFDPVTVQRLWSHLRTLLAGAAADGACALADLPWLDPGERWQLVGEWNDTACDLPAVCVHELIERQAASCPDATALIAADLVLSYGELQRRAYQLAHHLRGLGVGPGVVVGLLLEREAEMLVGLLGVLATGAAYLPLDPEYPAERSAWIIADAAPRLVLTSERLAPRLPVPGPGVVCLDRDWRAIAGAGDGADGLPRAGALDLAYLIYTSGSTGRPKGVEVSHGALANLLLSMREQPGLAAADRLLAVTSLSFDIAGLELFLPLVCGAQVVLAGRDDVVDGQRLAGLAARCDATVMQGTPATWRLLLDSGWPGNPGLVALCGGEGLPADLAAEIRGRCAALWNLYGPTETTVWSAVHAVAPAGRGLQPLGRPIANTEIHLLAAGAAQPVPTGGVGELCIGGAGVARGYRNQPALTAERFVPDPFAARRGARLYRTGDLARALPSGVLEFLGRTDHQVKVRGFRIELGEIESVLAAHPAVQQAAVVVRREAAGNPLVAYVVPRPGAAGAPAAADLRGCLAERLPEFMIPAAFVVLERLPLTPNGKLDRGALAARELAPERGGPAYAAPRTAVEEVLAAIWGDVLARHPIGRDDDFFALGGHSLLAARVASRIRRAFGLEVPLRSLFERRSLAELASDIELRRRGAGVLPLAAIEPAERGGELPLSFGQERLWFAHQLDPSSAAYNVHLPVALTGVLDRAALGRALAELVGRHESLRTVFPSRAGRAQQVVLPPQPPALPCLDLAAHGEHAEREARRLGEEESQVPFDLGRGPLLRARLLRLAAASHVLLLTLHHVITDAWSMNVLIVELAALYDAFATGAAPALPRLPIQYADYASWQRRWLSEETLERELSWWRSRLHGAPERSALPFDGPAVDPPSPRGAGHRFVLPLKLSRALLELSRREAATLFMTLLAVFKVLLYRTTGQEDVIVGTNVANRNRLETEGLIGFFVNDVALRTDLGGNPTFQQLLARVRETTLDAFSHQDLPFEKLVSGLRLSGSARQRPIFQILCTLDDDAGPADAVAVHGLALDLLPALTEPAKFDLSLVFIRRDEAIAGCWVYSEGLFAQATIERLTEGFLALAAHVAEQPEMRLDSFDRLPAVERDEREKKRAEQQERRLASLKRGRSRGAVLVTDGGAGE
ncbi:MAG TPA: amino acid adenylation domain-containing protein, partial [Thermoanaerobaculia bacterium]